MSTVPNPYLTESEYLAKERKASFKSEYYRGDVFAMSGAKRAHNLIAMNVGTTLSIHLRDRDCEVYPSDMKVKVSPTGLYTYPDVSVVCDHPEFEDEVGDVLLNPQVLVEVLSDSTEADDRGAKFEQYRQIASLRDYVLIAQNRMFVEHYLRQPTGSWLLSEYRQSDDEVELESIGCQLLLADLYRKVKFEETC